MVRDTSNINKDEMIPNINNTTVLIMSKFIIFAPKHALFKIRQEIKCVKKKNPTNRWMIQTRDPQIAIMSFNGNLSNIVQYCTNKFNSKGCTSHNGGVPLKRILPHLSKEINNKVVNIH